MSTPRSKADLANLDVERTALSLPEVAASTGVSYETARQWVRSGAVPSFPVGQQYFVPVDLLKAALRRMAGQDAA